MVVCLVIGYFVSEKRLIFCVELINSEQTRKADLGLLGATLKQLLLSLRHCATNTLT